MSRKKEDVFNFVSNRGKVWANSPANCLKKELINDSFQVEQFRFFSGLGCKADLKIKENGW